jgi:hypothetical protein
MSIKDDLKNTVGKIKDAASEAGHKSTAEAEHDRRDVAGDTMTTSEKRSSSTDVGRMPVIASESGSRRETLRLIP